MYQNDIAYFNTALLLFQNTEVIQLTISLNVINDL